MQGWPATEASLVFRDRVADHDVDRRGSTGRHGRRRPRRTDDGERVRRPQRQHHEAQRRDAQPVAARPFDRRLVGRQFGGRGRRARHARHRRRRWRFDPHPGRLHRPARDEGHLRPHPARARTRSPPEHGRARWPGPLGARRGALYDVCAGYDPGDPSSLPATGGWEAGLGTHDLRGRRVAIVPDLGGVTARARRRGRIRDGGQDAHRRDRHGRGRRRPRAPEPRRAVDDGQPRRRCSPSSATAGRHAPATSPTRSRSASSCRSRSTT